jgi:suppressor for copper-sensitivity B
MRLSGSFEGIMPPVKEIGLTAVLAVVVGLSAGRAHAAASEWITTDFSQLRLIAAHDSSNGDRELDIGVQVRMEEGWKTYWRNPGDAGFPSLFDWSASQNVSDVLLAWPAPKRISFDGLDSFGYQDEVVFPVRVRTTDTATPVVINVDIAYAVCKNICVPLEATVSLEIPAGTSSDTPGTKAHRALIQRFSGRVPSREEAQIEIADATVRRIGSEKVLRMRVSARASFDHPDVFIEGPADVFFGRPRVELASDKRTAIIEVPMDVGGSAYVSRPLTITLVDGARAIERTVSPTTE